MKRAAGVPAASVATAVDLGAVCALDANAGDPRANAHYMELHEEDFLPSRNLVCFRAKKQLRRVRVD